MQAGRDVWWHESIEGQSPVCDPVWVDAEHPLFLLYTSGSTGKPKGIQHSSAGYLLGAKTTSQWVFDLRDDDVLLVYGRCGLGDGAQLRRVRSAGGRRDRRAVRRRADVPGWRPVLEDLPGPCASLSSTPRRRRSAR